MKKRSLRSAATDCAEEEQSSDGMQESAGVEGWRIKQLEQTGWWREVKRKRRRRKAAGGIV